MTLLDQLDELEKRAGAAPWGFIPGCGENDDEGYFVIGAVGPEYRFLVGDHWEYEDQYPRPMGLRPEDEATDCARRDQDFINTLRNSWPQLSAALRAGAEWLSAYDKHVVSTDIVGHPITVARESFRACLQRLEDGKGKP